VLRALVKEMDDRYLLLVANRQRKVHQHDGWKLQVSSVTSWPSTSTPPTGRPTGKPAT
jgi:hypothetical protein